MPKGNGDWVESDNGNIDVDIPDSSNQLSRDIILQQLEDSKEKIDGWHVNVAEDIDFLQYENMQVKKINTLLPVRSEVY